MRLADAGGPYNFKVILGISGYCAPMLGMTPDEITLLLTLAVAVSFLTGVAALALPRPRQRWTVRRKANVIEAVRGGWVP